MRRINGHYETPEGRQISFDFEVASKWEELDPHQCASIILVISYSKADKYVIAVSLLSLLFQKHWNVISQLDDETIHALIPCTNFLLEEAPPVKNFFPSLKINKKVCLAPDESLGNMGFGEWCFAYQFYSYYVLTKDIAWLNKLIACLYRPVDPKQIPGTIHYKGDQREVFNENLIEKRSLGVAHLEEKFRMAIYAWFTAAVNQIMLQRPNVFPPAPEYPEGLQEQPEDNRTWLSVFRELLGPKWGTTEQLKYTNAMFILDELEEKKIEYDAAMKAAKG